MNDIWLYEGNGFNNEYIKRSVKLRLSDMYKQEWHTEIQTHEYCDFYAIIKDQWGQMTYLKELNYFDRKKLCKWRCRSNSLPIASSRYVISDEILCPLCRGDAVGDEMHYLFKCPFFYDDRINYMGDIPQNHVNFHVMNMFKDTMNINGLIKFINLIMSIFEHRNDWDHSIVNDLSLYDEEEEI